MAGAGYKLFNTGDVLTAAQVNTYLMEQTVMVFADAAARTTALTGVVSEGMLSYLKDTNAVEVYNGSAWVASDDPNAIQNTIVDAKGDLITATAADTPARLAAGNNGETLVADSSTSTGLRYSALFGANKNKIINGDFNINQRAFSSTTSTGVYSFDRWLTNFSDGTNTFSAESFTPGAAPVAGYEGKNYIRIVTTGQTTTGAFTRYDQRIEDVRTFAGQTVTVSFWAQAGSGTPGISVELQQNFGSGGSPSSVVNGIIASPANQAISTSWARYSYTISVPSISGKTIGTNENSYFQLGLFVSAGSNFNARTGSLGIQSNTFNIWGVQVEAGSVATPFQTATGTIQGETALCQRYYYRLNSPGSFTRMATGMAFSTTASEVVVPFPVSMRIKPTALEQSGTAGDYCTYRANSSTDACTAVPSYASATLQNGTVVLASTNLVAGNATFLLDNNKAANVAYLAWSAEL